VTAGSGRQKGKGGDRNGRKVGTPTFKIKVMPLQMNFLLSKRAMVTYTLNAVFGQQVNKAVIYLW